MQGMMEYVMIFPPHMKVLTDELKISGMITFFLIISEGTKTVTLTK